MHKCLRRNSTYVLGAAEGHAGDATDALELELLNGLASLLLVAGVDDLGRSRGTALVTSLDLRVGAVILLVDLGAVLGLLVGEFFDTGVGHICCCEWEWWSAFLVSFLVLFN